MFSAIGNTVSRGRRAQVERVVVEAYAWHRGAQSLLMELADEAAEIGDNVGYLAAEKYVGEQRADWIVRIFAAAGLREGAR